MTDQRETRVRPALNIQVDCVAGHRGEKTPARLRLGSRVIDALEVVDQWHGPDHRYFKVRAAEGELYIVRLDVQSLEWELTLYSSEQYLTGRTDEPRGYSMRQTSVS